MVATTAHRRGVVDLVGVIAVVVGLVLGLVPGIATPSASAAHGALGVNEFEIDGNTTGAHDWAGLGGEQTPDTVATASATDANTFTDTSQKESDYPNWVIEPGNVPNKDDLHRLFVQTQVAADSFVWLGATRVADEGNVQVTAEFNKDSLTEADMEGDYRTVGDFFIRFNFPGNTNAAVDAYYAEWTGSAWGPETQLGGNDFRAAVGTLGAENREFVELEINLRAIFGQGGQLECDTFGTIGFRTESSGGNNNNNEPVLKDFAGPFPIDLDTCGEITVEKVDAEGNPLAGAEFTLYEGSDTTGTVVATCVTDDTGTCSLGSQLPGTYTIDETVVPDGYEKAAGLPETFSIGTNESADLGPYTDPRIDYVISVDPDGNNAVGNDHVFTVHLEDGDGAAMAGEEIDLVWTGVGDGITAIDGVEVGPFSTTTCTTDADGDCEVTVSSDVPGSGELAAYWGTPYQNAVTADPAVSATAGEPVDEITDSATKTWIGYRAEIAADGLNLVGQDHTFTATVYEVDGTEPDELAAGVTVTFDWDAGTADGSGLDSATCVTDVSGTCTVTASDGGTPGTGTISIVQLDGVVGDDEALQVTFEAGDIAATKTWREYRATIDDDSVNPAGQDHTFNVTVEYRDDEAQDWQPAADGTTVAWNSSGDGSDDLAASTCDDGTSGGTCTIVVTSDAPGSRTVTLVSVDGALLGDAGTDSETYAVSDEATKTWLDFTVDITPNGDNLAGEEHTFTVHVQKYDGVEYTDVEAGTIIVFETSDGGATLDSETCSAGTDANGECTITVLSATAGTVTVTVTGIDGYTGFDEAADVTFETPGEATKTWYEYRAFIEADAVNLVGDPHDFTVTAQVNDGSGWTAVEDGTVVTVTSSGIAADVDQSDCADGTTGGTCTVTVNSATPGTVTITVATVGNLSAVNSDVTSVDVSAGADLEEGQSASASKTWIDYRASIVESATNLTGEEHTFTVTAEQNDGSGWVTVPDGTSVSYSTDNDGTVQGDTCASTVGGQCTITVNSTEVDSVTVTVTAVSAEDVDGDPTAQIEAGEDTSATKTWIEVLVSAEADATNLAGDEHVFTVSIDVLSPTFPAGFMAPDGTTAVVSSSGTGSIIDSTCDDGTVDGECTVTVQSDDPGSLTISVDSVSFSYDGSDFVVDLDGSFGVADGQDREATKTWRAYRLDIEADGLNLVRDDHEFTVTVEQTDDGENWTAVPDGTTVDVAITGTGSISDDVCGTGGTTGGTCTVTVSSDEAGTGTVTASAVGVVHPETEQTVSFDTADDSADKTWVAFRSTISRDSVNLTGDPHDFTITTEYTSDGSTWLPVPDGSSVDFESTGVGSVDSDTCDSTVGGDCTVTVVSSDSGQRSVTVTGVVATVTVSGIEETFEVAYESGASGVLDGFSEATATKTWASYALELTPAEAVNLLPTNPDHDITAILTSDDAVNAPIAGQTIDLTISGAVGLITASPTGTVAGDGLSATCVTDDGGLCTITISSTTPGTATVSGSYDATVGDSEPFTVEGNDAVKTWTTFRVTVEADAVNLVGNAHEFVVTIEQSDPSGEFGPVAGAVPSIEVTGTDVSLDTSDCDGGTDAAGQCSVFVNSDDVQAVTLTATYDAAVGQQTAAFSDQGDKTWIDYALTVTPEIAENLVDTDHVFTVTITTTYPLEEGTQTDPVVGAFPTIELTGEGAITDNDCATNGTGDDGTCTVTISSATTGVSELTATFLGTAAGTEAEGDEESREYSDSGMKAWWDYDLSIDPEAVNAVGDAHEFVATLLVDRGDGQGFVADEGEVVGVTIGGDAGGLVSETCSTGTDANGQCTITVNADTTGTTTVAVSYLAEVGETTGEFNADTVKYWTDIQLTKTPVDSTAPDDGDLAPVAGLTDPSTNTEILGLQFNSSTPGPLTAVYEFVITNTGPVTLTNIVLTDDRIGTILDGTEGITLEPGESTTVRADEAFTVADLQGGGIVEPAFVTNIGTVTGTPVMDPDVTVSDQDDAQIVLNYVEGTPNVRLDKRVVFTGEANDLGSDVVKSSITDPRFDLDDPFGFIGDLRWTPAETEADTPKTMVFEYVITNTSVDQTLTNIVLTDVADHNTEVLADGSIPLIELTVLDGTEGITLAPGESTTVQASITVRPSTFFNDAEYSVITENAGTGAGWSKPHLNEAVVTTTLLDGTPGPESREDGRIETTAVLAETVAAAGLGNAGILFPVSLLLTLIGAAVLYMNRRWTITR